MQCSYSVVLFLFYFLDKLGVVDGGTGITVPRLSESCSQAPLPEKSSLTMFKSLLHL